METNIKRNIVIITNLILIITVINIIVIITFLIVNIVFINTINIIIFSDKLWLALKKVYSTTICFCAKPNWLKGKIQKKILLP